MSKKTMTIRIMRKNQFLFYSPAYVRLLWTYAFSARAHFHYLYAKGRISSHIRDLLLAGL